MPTLSNDDSVDNKDRILPSSSVPVCDSSCKDDEVNNGCLLTWEDPSDFMEAIEEKKVENDDDEENEIDNCNGDDVPLPRHEKNLSSVTTHTKVTIDKFKIPEGDDDDDDDDDDNNDNDNKS
mmetsp:Transcript_52931/g.57459  ORF Transcript_52931/g.57459 Transcript_52931/m.57459 type:complete len:122 (+) Transcript_52931:1-366(+)